MSDNLIVFSLDDQRYALLLDTVERILRAVEVTPIPRGPDIVLGVINVQGQIIPVVNVRRRFGLPEREIDIDDRLIVARTSKMTVVLPVDGVDGIRESSKEEMTPSEKITPGMDYFEGVIKFDDGLIFLHDIGRFLSLDEETMLENAVSRMNG